MRIVKPKTIFGRRLKLLKLERGVNNGHIEAETGVLRNCISHWCTAYCMPNSEGVIAMSKYFNVSADYLLGLSERRERATQQWIPVSSMRPDLGVPVLVSSDDDVTIDSMVQRNGIYIWFERGNVGKNDAWQPRPAAYEGGKNAN